MCGIPGAGKTTYGGRYKHAALASTEALRTCRNLNRNAFFAGLDAFAAQRLTCGDVVVDGCATTASVRAKWLACARNAGAETELVLLLTPASVALARNNARPFSERVPPQVMARYVAEFRQSLDVVDSEGWDRIVEVGSRSDWGA